MTLTMRKLTVYIVFRLNYNCPDSNLHLFVSFETRRFHYDFILQCGVTACAHAPLAPSVQSFLDNPLTHHLVAKFQFG
jgi:hypothetical protein